MTIEKVRCPRLNDYYREASMNRTAHAAPDNNIFPHFEVMVRFSRTASKEEVPTGIMCEFYDSDNDKCGVGEGKDCMYRIWKGVR